MLENHLHFFFYEYVCSIKQRSTNFCRELWNGCPLMTTVELQMHIVICQYLDEGAWWATVHGVAESRTRLSDFTFTFHSYALEKEMATHSSVLALRIPGTGEPGELPSMGSHRVGHDWSDLAAAAAVKIKYFWQFHSSVLILQTNSHMYNIRPSLKHR